MPDGTATDPTGSSRRPDIVVILADDLGFSDLGCYGGEIATPNLDALAAGGVRMTQFRNAARCSPARASLLTGQHPHATGIGILTQDLAAVGYPGVLSTAYPTLAEVLGDAGYATAMTGKWHLTGAVHDPSDGWPTRRGFDRYWGTVAGGGSYYNPSTLTDGEDPVDYDALPADWYYTDAIADHAAGFIREHAQTRPEQPLFSYVAFTAPHWPLHAPEGTIAEVGDRYLAGWDALRQRRLDRLVELGLLPASVRLSPRDPRVPAWADTGEAEWEARRMAVYAAQVMHLDAGVGRIVEALRSTGRLDDTLLIFLSDNGASSEGQPYGLLPDAAPDERPHLRPRTRDGRRVRRGNRPDVVPGPDDTFCSAGTAWSNVSNTPFRLHKSWTHEGGIATPFIAHWPTALPGGLIDHHPYQLTSVMPTLLAACGVPQTSPVEGVSMLPSWRGGPGTDHDLHWEHEGNAAIRRGPWKLVREWHLDGPGRWELYRLSDDPTELDDLAGDRPDLVTELAGAWQAWADRVGVVPRDRVLAHINADRSTPFDPEARASRDQSLRGG